MSDQSNTLFNFFTANAISYQRFDHPAVFTCEESKKLCPDMPGANTKNLFLKHKKKDDYFLVSVGHHKAVDLKAFAKSLGFPAFSFGSPEMLKELLGVEPGAVTLLGLMNDAQKQVRVIIDKDLWQHDAFCCHPLVNTSTLVISKEELLRFFALTGHGVEVLDVPARSNG